MTRAEAIEFGKKILCIAHPQKDASAYEFTQMAIQALSQEPCDAISRKAAIAKIRDEYKGYMQSENYAPIDFVNIIETLPSVTVRQTGDDWRKGFLAGMNHCLDIIKQERGKEWQN